MNNCKEKVVINQEYLKNILNYDEFSGLLIWKNNGKRAGCEHSSGYRMIGLLGKKYKEHRIIWMYVYGNYPTLDIDHINRVKNDNRISNLRLLSESDNAQNMVKAQRHSKTGILGVSPSKNKYQASITAKGIQKYLGRFNTIKEAENAYLKAKSELHKSCFME